MYDQFGTCCVLCFDGPYTMKGMFENNMCDLVILCHFADGIPAGGIYELSLASRQLGYYFIRYLARGFIIVGAQAYKRSLPAQVLIESGYTFLTAKHRR